MARSLVPCVGCSELVYEGTCVCPHCGEKHACTRRALSPQAAMLGLSLMAPGCFLNNTHSDYTGAATGGGGWDSGTEYTDDDGDGYSEDQGDCDDADALRYPGAEETPGDGVDSNCDGEDDT